MTLAEALREGYKRHIYEWRLVPVQTEGGLVKFFIHGLGKNSVTLDFALDEDVTGKEFLEPSVFNTTATFPD